MPFLVMDNDFIGASWVEKELWGCSGTRYRELVERNESNASTLIAHEASSFGRGSLIFHGMLVEGFGLWSLRQPVVV